MQRVAIPLLHQLRLAEGEFAGVIMMLVLVVIVAYP